MKLIFDVKMEEKVIDSITGFIGTVTGVAYYQNGCKKVLVEQNSLTQDGKFPEGIWLDEQRVSKRSKSSSGGPMINPPIKS